MIWQTKFTFFIYIFDISFIFYISLEYIWAIHKCICNLPAIETDFSYCAFWNLIVICYLIIKMLNIILEIQSNIINYNYKFFSLDLIDVSHQSINNRLNQFCLLLLQIFYDYLWAGASRLFTTLLTCMVK